MKYDMGSAVAGEFINHEEILETVAFAEKNKDNKALLEEILAKARNKKGISHREALTLLECTDAEINEKTFELAREIKNELYGNRIVLFAPLYLSNYCVNGCIYCPYHAKNKWI